MVILEIIDVFFTIISIIKPLIVFGLIIAVVIKITKSSGNNKYVKPNGYNNQYNQPYNMNQNGYNTNQYNQPYNMNQNGYNTNQYSQPYNTNQSLNNQAYYNANTTTSANVNGGHDHAYEHKVAPIVEASVMDKFEDRKEAYLDRKQQMKADLPKTSYSKMEELNDMKSSSSYEINVNAQVGKSSNAVLQMNDSQEKLVCKNCGAENIVPASRSTAYSCYFCKEVL